MIGRMEGVAWRSYFSIFTEAFMNLDEIQNEDGRHYVRTWVVALDIILKWPEQRTLVWADKWLASMNDPNAMFFNGTPADYIIPLMIPERLRKRLPSYELEHVREQLLTAIQQYDSFCDRKPDFNWELARKRVEVVLAEYGETLPALQNESGNK